jgi:Cysteine-rich secretory protein family
VKDFRAALLCLINEARASQKLPALKRSAELERVAQAQSNTFARTGSASHGSSLSDIAARFAKVGYHSAAYDEAFDDLDEGATPYLFLSHMLGRASIPCSEIFDPRFRDVGIGATVAPVGVDTLALEFGAARRATAALQQRSSVADLPSQNTGPDRFRDAGRWRPSRAHGQWVNGQSRPALHCARGVRADLEADASRRAGECGQWERDDTCGCVEDGHLHLRSDRCHRRARCVEPERVAQYRCDCARCVRRHDLRTAQLTT